MNDIIKMKLNKMIKNEAKLLLKNKDLENRLDDLDDLYIFRRVLENYEELEPTLREFFVKKDKKRLEGKNEIDIEK